MVLGKRVETMLLKHYSYYITKIRGAFADELKLIMPRIDGRGDVIEWIGHAKSEIELCKIVMKGENRERGKFEGKRQRS